MSRASRALSGGSFRDQSVPLAGHRRLELVYARCVFPDELISTTPPCIGFHDRRYLRPDRVVAPLDVSDTTGPTWNQARGNEGIWICSPQENYTALLEVLLPGYNRVKFVISLPLIEV